MAIKEKFLFICQIDEEGEIGVFTKSEADSEISVRETDDEMDFKVLGRISTTNLTADFPPTAIEWYDKNITHPTRVVDDAIVKIIQKIINGYNA